MEHVLRLERQPPSGGHVGLSPKMSGVSDIRESIPPKMKLFAMLRLTAAFPSEKEPFGLKLIPGARSGSTLPCQLASSDLPMAWV